MAATTSGIFSGIDFRPNKKDRRRARDIIDVQYQPQINQLKRSQTQTRTDYKRLLQDLIDSQQRTVQTQRGFVKEGDVALQDIFNELRGDLEGGRNRIAQAFEGAKGRTGAGYDAAIAATQAQGSDVAKSISDFAAKFGLQQAAPEQLAKVQGELANIAGQAQTSKAQELGNLETFGAQDVSTAERAINASRQEMGQERARLVTDANKAIGDANLEFAQGRTKLSEQTSDQLFEIAGRLSDTLGARGKDLRETIRQVFEARTDRERQAKLDNMQMQIEQSKLALERERNSMARRELSAKLKEAKAENPRPWERLNNWLGKQGVDDKHKTAIRTVLLRAGDSPENAMGMMAALMDSDKGLKSDVLERGILQFFEGQGGSLSPGMFSSQALAAKEKSLGVGKPRGNVLGVDRNAAGQMTFFTKDGKKVTTSSSGGPKPSDSPPAGSYQKLAGSNMYQRISADGSTRYIYDKNKKFLYKSAITTLRQG